MSRDAVLPFDLGNTHFEGTVSTDYPANELIGREFVVEDVDYDGDPVADGTGFCRTVRIVKAGAAISNIGKLCMESGTAANEFGRVMDNLTNGAGDVGFPVDYSYLTTADLVLNDLFYVCVKGPAELTASAAISIADDVTATSSGKIVSTTTGGHHVLGKADEAASSDGDVIRVVVHLPHVRIDA